VKFLATCKAQPFRPFRIRMNSGRTFDIRHPEMVRKAVREMTWRGND